MNWRLLIFSFFILILIHPAAQAATEVRGDGEIVAVTVFPGRAEVTRNVRVSLPAGESTVVIEGLPASLIGDSVRVQGQAAGTLLIGSVETKRRFTEVAVRAEERALQENLEALRDRRRALDDQAAAAKVQLNFIAAIGRESPRIATDGVMQGRLDPEAWRTAIAVLGESAAGAYETIRATEIERRALGRKIKRIENQLARVHTGRKASISARINVQTGAPLDATLNLSYQLGGASWRPLYEARLESETGKTELVQIGEVRQGTGEDWSGVRLTLSTARPSQNAQIPTLPPWFVDFAQMGYYRADRKAKVANKAPNELDQLRDSMALSKSVTGGAGEMMAEAEALKSRDAEAILAQAVASEFAAEFRIPGKARVPSDKEPHKFVITRQDFDAELSVQTVPKIAPRAYLAAEITYEGETPLLPGPVALFRDGAFVGRGGLAMLRPGEEIKLSFGVDDKVRVTYALVTGERSSEGLFNTNRRIERRYRIEVANHHKQAMKIAVLDQLPVPRDERIEVELLRGSTKPDERDVEGVKGVLAWRGTYEPGAEKVIKFGYAVIFPEDHQVPGF